MKQILYWCLNSLQFKFLYIIGSWTLTFAQDKSIKQELFQTKIFIQTSKPHYLLGEKIWLSAYLLNAKTNQLLINKHPLYVQLYAPDGKLVSDQILYTNAGRGSGFVALLPSIRPGVYRLHSFTQSMRLSKQPSFEQRIYIGTVPSNIETKNTNNDAARLYVSTKSTTYSKRKPVEVILETDGDLEATLSVSVYQESSDLINRQIMFDSKVSKGEFTFEEPDEQILFMGKALRANGSTIDNGHVVLSLNLPNGQQTFVASTDSVGFFIFKDMVFEGEQTAYWQINNAKGKVVSDATIHWIKFPRISAKIDSLPIQKETIQMLQQPAVYLSDGDSLSLDSKMLDEVTVKAKKQEPPSLGLPVLHKDTDISFAVNFEQNQLLPNDANGNNFAMMLKYLPSCAGSASDPPKYLIDGVVVHTAPHQVIDLSQIKRIELLRGANAMMYGSTCVYAIYTFGVEKYTKKNKATPAKIVKLQSYQPPQKFYSPNYDIEKFQTEDNRQTLYWNPKLILEQNQKEIPIRFFSSDVSGTYRVVVQGMSNLGPVYAEKSFRVE